jgi:predicted nucleic-acid-binding Zn-ribbon protein
MLDFDKLLGREKRYGPVTVHGQALRCVVCRHDEFWEHHVQMHTPVATFLNLEFANRIANCAVCASCGYVHFFLPTDLAPEAAEEGGNTS